MISIDGSTGEGGGQLLRTALSLSLVLGQPFKIVNIRAGRQRPGLLRQHLTAVLAAAEIGEAMVEGAFLGSTAITFSPRTIKPGKYHFAIGTAGSGTLVLQTILPALIVGSWPSQITIEGGTHNIAAPPFDFLARTFLPLIEKMGPKFQVNLERYGFYPAGGGRFVIDIVPCEVLRPIDVVGRESTSQPRVHALVANLPRHIAQREANAVAAALVCDTDHVKITETKNSAGPGNVVMVEVETSAVTEIFTAFGKMGVSAENVAADVVAQVQAYLTSEAAICEHLADQLLLPMAMAGRGSFTTVGITSHTRTNMDVIARFLPVTFASEDMAKYARVALLPSR